MKHVPANDVVIYKSMDHDSFRIREDNRDIKQKRVDKLKMLIESNPDLRLHPIIVNSELEIIDGQTRWSVAREMNLPVYYVIDDRYEPIKMVLINTSQDKWNIEDYMKFWIENGKEDYLKMKNVMEEFGFSFRNFNNWIGLGRNSSEMMEFKRGNFVFILDESTRKAMTSAKRFFDEFKHKINGKRALGDARNLHVALRNFFCSKIVDHDRFFEKLDICPHGIRPAAQWSDYFEQLIVIYNWKARQGKVVIATKGNEVELTEE